MTKAKTKKVSRSTNVLARKTLRELLFESDSTYLLKLVAYALLATVWLKLGDKLPFGAVTVSALPLGLFVSLLLVRLVERHQLDRKILYATVMVIGIITAFLPAGIQL